MHFPAYCRYKQKKCGCSEYCQKKDKEKRAYRRRNEEIPDNTAFSGLGHCLRKKSCSNAGRTRYRTTDSCLCSRKNAANEGKVVPGHTSCREGIRQDEKVLEVA